MARKLSKRKWSELAETKVFKEQAAKIKKECGKKAAEQANYGWGVASDGGVVDVATKVYGKKARILSSRAEYPSLEIEHTWSDYTTAHLDSLS